MSEELEIREELKEIVIMRIEAIPSNLKLSIGDDKTLTKEGLCACCHFEEHEEWAKEFSDENKKGR